MGLSCCKSANAAAPNWNRKGYQAARSVNFITRMRSERTDWKEEDAMVVYVTILGMSELKKMTNLTNLSGPYVECSLTPDDPVAGAQKQRTSFQPRTANPRWTPGERLQFLITSKNEKSRIRINAYNFHLIRADELLGDAIINIRNINIGDDKDVTVKLVDPANGQQQGEIQYHIEVVTVKRALARREDMIYEFQRWQPGIEWGYTRPGHFLPNDPGRYCTSNGRKYGDTIESVVSDIPDGWSVSVQWHSLATEDDPDGWQYSTDFMSLTWAPTPSPQSTVRRRAVVREICAPYTDESASASPPPGVDSRDIYVEMSGSSETANPIIANAE